MKLDYITRIVTIAILAILLFLIAGAAFATNTPTPQPVGVTNNVSTVSASASDSRSSSAARSAADASAQGGFAAATGGAGGHSDSRASASGGSVSGVVGGEGHGGAATSTTTVNGDSSVYVEKRQAPPAFAALANTTAECYSSVGVGLSSPVGGISFGTGRKAKDCSRLKLAELMYAKGAREAGDRMLCSVSEVRAALGADCLTLIAVVAPAAPLVDTSQFVTREELAERERRIERTTRRVGK
jgi:hypothetical protein